MRKLVCPSWPLALARAGWSHALSCRRTPPRGPTPGCRTRDTNTVHCKSPCASSSRHKTPARHLARGVMHVANRSITARPPHCKQFSTPTTRPSSTKVDPDALARVIDHRFGNCGTNDANLRPPTANWRRTRIVRCSPSWPAASAWSLSIWRDMITTHQFLATQRSFDLKSSASCPPAARPAVTRQCLFRYSCCNHGWRLVSRHRWSKSGHWHPIAAKFDRDRPSFPRD